MSRIALTTVILLLLTLLTAGNGISQEKGEGKGQMKGMEMKGMDMKAAPVMACMRPKGEPPKGPATGKVVILEPANGALITSRTVKVAFDIPEKGSFGNHLHIYLDGRCRNMIRSGRTYYLSSLREGKHKIELRLVSKDHHEYGPSATVEITVRLK